MSTFLSIDDRKKFRTSISHLTDFNYKIETALRKKTEIPLHIRQKVFELTNCTDMGEAYDALLDIKDTTQEAYLSKLLDMAPKSLSAFAEYMNPEEPPAPHHEFLIEHLEAIESGDLLRMMLSMPPGHAKPITVDAPVMMEDGTYKALGDIVVGDKVVTHKARARTVTAVHDQGQLETWEIHLASGRVIRCAADHPFLTGRGWIECQHLDKMDALFPINYDLQDLSSYSIDDFKLAGMICGAGHLVFDDGVFPANRVNIIIDPTQGSYLQEVLTLADTTGIKAGIAFSARGGMRVNRAYFTASSNHKLMDLELDEALLQDTIPAWVFNGSSDQVSAFLISFWRGKSVDINQPGDLKNYKFRACYFKSITKADLVAKLFWRIGFNTTVSPFTYSKQSKETGLNVHSRRKVVCNARISLDNKGLSKLWESLEGIDYRSRGAITRTQYDTLVYDPVSSVINTGTYNAMKCLTIEEDSSFTVHGIATHNSTYASHLFGAWFLGRNPKKRFLQAGHTQKFCEDELGKKVRNYIKNERFQNVFPEVRVSQDSSAAATWAIEKFNGKYMVRAVGQGIAGIRGHIGAVDDPYPALADAESQGFRDKVYNWFNADFKTRLLPNSPLYIVMTRWHPDDLVGRILEHEKNGKTIPFTVINLPVFCTDEENDPLGRKIGDKLWNLFDDDFLLDMKNSLSPRQWASLYTGEPIPSEGAMLSPDWIRRYKTLPQGDKFVTISVDTANKATERSDFTVITVWYQYGNTHYLIDVIRRKMEYNEIKSTIELHARKHRANVILIEDAGTGTQYHTEATKTEHKPPCPVVAIKPHGSSKDFKFDASLPQWESGNVFLPEQADWLSIYETEMLSFPIVKHDDQADATSMYLLYRRPKPQFGSQKMGSTKDRNRTFGGANAREPVNIIRPGAIDMSLVSDAP